jgi:hypothetical protein
VIFQPFSNSELQAISALNQLATRQNVRGMTGGRIWNITPWWWDVFGDAEPARPQGLVAPWSFVEFELESIGDMLEVLIASATDLNPLPLSSSTVWRLMLQFLDSDVHPQVLSLSQQLANTDLVKVQQSPLPAGATPVNNSSGNVAAAAATATLAGAAGVFTWLTGFEVTGGGATAASVILVTVTGAQGGTLTYVLVVPAGATTSIVPLVVEPPAPIRSSAVNTSIAVNVPSFGAGNTNASVVAHGYTA